MDDLRWILAAIGIVLVAAIYFSGRFEREEWRRDREGFSGFSKLKTKPGKRAEKKTEKQPVPKVREEPQFNIQNEVVETAPGERKEVVKDVITQEGKEDITKDQKTPGQVVEARRPESGRSVSTGINSEEDAIKALGETEQPKVKKVVERPEEKPEKEVELKDETKVERAERIEEKQENEKQIEDDWESAVVSINEPLIEDEIVNVEIPEELTGPDSKSGEEAEVKAGPDIEEPVQQELKLEIEPLALALTVMGKGDNLLEGKSIRRILEGSGLKCDDNGIYQFHMTGKKDAVFSVVSAIEPGVFEMDTINEYETPGLVFICQLPGPLPGKDMFRIMQMKALNIAEKLGAQLCDDKRNLLTEQAITHYNDRITEFDREVVLARKKLE